MENTVSTPTQDSQINITIESVNTNNTRLENEFNTNTVEFSNKEAHKKHIYDRMYCCVLMKNCNKSCDLLFPAVYYSLVVLSYFVFIVLLSIGMLAASDTRSETSTTTLFNPICIGAISTFSFSMLLLVLQRLSLFKFISLNQNHGPYDSSSTWACVFFFINCIFTFISLMVNVGTANLKNPSQIVLDGSLLAVIVISIGNCILYFFFFLFPRYTNVFHVDFVAKKDGTCIERFKHNYLNNDVSTYVMSIFCTAFGYNIFFDILSSLTKNNLYLTYICIYIFSVLTIFSYMYSILFGFIYLISECGLHFQNTRLFDNAALSFGSGPLFVCYILFGGMLKTMFYFFNSTSEYIDKTTFFYNFSTTYLFVSMILFFIFIGLFIVFCIISCFRHCGRDCSMCCTECCKRTKEKAIEATQNTENEMNGYEKNIT